MLHLQHDIATKFALGWLHPYVVNGACDLTLRPSQTSGDCLLFPAKGSTWNGSAFTEYLLLELYTPTGLNELDATTAYSYHPQGYTLPGVRLLHDVSAGSLDHQWLGLNGFHYPHRLPRLFSFRSNLEPIVDPFPLISIHLLGLFVIGCLRFDDFLHRLSRPLPHPRQKEAD